MEVRSTGSGTLIRPFAWEDWRALWTIRFAQLAEHGVPVEPSEIPERPESGVEDQYEWDFHHMGDVYLRGAGNFWLAWYTVLPVGYVGGQDIGGAIELRRMYVKAAWRQRGIGTALVRALIAHSRARGVHAIELWTAPDGPGRRLYHALGFRETSGPGVEFNEIALLTRYTPGTNENRMRLDLQAT
jgi:GNAT superfamily N-acetyltransferase